MDSYFIDTLSASQFSHSAKCQSVTGYQPRGSLPSNMPSASSDLRKAAV